MKNPSSQKRCIMKPLNPNKMKIALFIIPLFLLNCTKKDADSKMITTDSTEISAQNNVENPNDSSSKGVIFPSDAELDKKEMAKTFRVIDGDSIIKTVNGDMFPLTISDEFTTDRQLFILKIKNFTGKKITGIIKPENAEMNIRFNQIKLPNGEFDGPFGQEINYDVKEKGEVWLLIGKSLMASGKAKGKFTISLK